MSIVEFDCPPELLRFLRYQPAQQGPVPANLRELEHLLFEIWSKQEGKTDLDKRVLVHFQARCDLEQSLVDEYEQRVIRLLDKKPPILLSIYTDADYRPGRSNFLCVLVSNPTERLFREVRIHFSSPDLAPTDCAQPRPLKLLDSRDALPVYLTYRGPQRPLLTVLSLSVDVCDHRGEWRAYTSRGGILLNFPLARSDQAAKVRVTSGTANPAAWAPAYGPDSAAEEPAAGGTPITRRATGPGHSVPVELSVDPERTRQLQAVAAVQNNARHRGAVLTRALLRSENANHAPARIELVSRPLMVLGRYNTLHNRGLGDFSLGLLPRAGLISRVHCALRATAAGLEAMHVGKYEQGYTALNTNRLPRAEWQPLASGDRLDFCGLYQLTVALAWEKAAETPALAAEGSAQLDTKLLEFAELLHQLGKAKHDEALKSQCREVYGQLLRLQEQAARRIGSDRPGPLLYARLSRDDLGQQQVAHYYLPKRLSIGSSEQAGLRINADGVQPLHAELAFRENMYWLRNLAAQGEVRVWSHALENDETLPLEDGDTIRLGGARFVFQAY